MLKKFNHCITRHSFMDVVRITISKAWDRNSLLFDRTNPEVDFDGRHK